VIALVRVDNRLLHGQILETWIPRLAIKEIVVGDDEAASDDLARAAMTLCVPAGLPVRVVKVDEVPWAELSRAPHGVLVLVRDIAALTRARQRGLSPEVADRVNLGNVHFGAGRRPVTPSVFLDGDEMQALRALASAGFGIEARAIPSEPPAGLEEIERRYAGTH
jgi:N-acetylgalactosamine PTS system EIIB component